MILKLNLHYYQKIFFKVKASLIKDFLRNNRNIKLKMILVCMVEKESLLTYEGKKVKDQSKIYLHSRTYVNLEKTNVKIILKDMIYEVLIGLANYQEKGSGWYFKEIIKLEIHLVDYKPMKGGSYIKLPEFIKKKNAIINIENIEQKETMIEFYNRQANHGIRADPVERMTAMRERGLEVLKESQLKSWWSSFHQKRKREMERMAASLQNLCQEVTGTPMVSSPVLSLTASTVEPAAAPSNVPVTS